MSRFHSLLVLLVLFTCAAAYKWKEKWYNQMPLDHFDFANQKTFRLRYLINLDHYDQSKPGPIFFYTGNEGSIEVFAENTGFMWDLAPEFNAALVFAEHRYYGKTQPFGNESFANLDNLGPLSATQALGDFAVLIDAIKRDSKYRIGAKAAQSPVIAFGGSYGGMLAAWIRIKYPHLVAGSIAASAPVLQFPGHTPCWVYNALVTRTFSQSGPKCAETIKAFWPAVRNLSKTAEGRSFINNQFHLCNDSQLASAEDAQMLVDWLLNALGELPMINYPYPTKFLQPVPAWPVKAACKHLSDGAKQDERKLIQAMYKAISVYQNYTGKTECYDLKADSAPSLGTDGWTFQTCTDMVMPMCSNGTDMFEVRPWNFTKFTDYCAKKFFGVRPRGKAAVIAFGADQLQAASNILFSNGVLDPWSGGGITNLPFKNPSLVVVVLRSGAHHYDLRAANDADTAEVTSVRYLEQKVIESWIAQARRMQIHGKG